MNSENNSNLIPFELCTNHSVNLISLAVSKISMTQQQA